VLRDEGIDLSADQIVAELTRRGWAPQAQRPVQAVRSVLTELVRNDPCVRRVGPGCYQWWTPGERAGQLQEAPAGAE
jgi:hypothetical protein